MLRVCLFLVLFASVCWAQDTKTEAKSDIRDLVEHHYADNNGVKIHYVSLGEGPLAVMIHGFPDFWYTWRDQMQALSKNYRVVAVDLRGYNKSDAPKGVEQYTMELLTSDIVAVIRNEKREKALIIGHDWGGSISWSLAMFYPQIVEKLIICNLPHPNGIIRELKNNPQQHKNSEYARKIQQLGAKSLSIERLSYWVKDPEVKKVYVEAFKRSSFEAMANYYKANYPREPYATREFPKVKCSVLMIHGLKDWALLPGALNDTWLWLEKDLTLVTVPDSSHFVQQDASETVTRTMKMWLSR
ncbi:alpha/beta fold hydrolase [Candidatus Uabimicrobium amorphum]|uniref:Alpha/beta hydrolase n=1 Tax=Uabimicrobium amorphum TaxID=2596890 RepID=A0A5S9IME8_UABAM|nr:alpha/beta hydrolase [Candidatus Uabimicrobium amorphum]BBM84220.1 alpha/beta hydrolase [Candidatus Uabimicrobium amorphum]